MFFVNKVELIKNVIDCMILSDSELRSFLLLPLMQMNWRLNLVRITAQESDGVMKRQLKKRCYNSVK
jgi:hypothetical protein